MNFYLGCAVWSYSGWVGSFYPPKSQPKDFLGLYSQRLSSVEGNTTFYAVPPRETLARWAAQTPAPFKFCPKLPKAVTHGGLLQPRLSEAVAFMERMETLGDRLGPVFAQLPPHYSPSYLEDLTAFLKALSGDQIALEVRHPDWFKEPARQQLEATLKQFGVGRVLLDTRPIYSSGEQIQQRPKPNLPLQPELTAFSLIRFISHPQQTVNQTFLQDWVKQIDRWLRQGTQIYFFMHCPEEERSPHIARYFQQLLEEQGVPVPPLLWDLNADPVQLSLF